MLMGLIGDLKTEVKSHRRLYRWCTYIRHPYVFRRDLEARSLRRGLLAAGPDELAIGSNVCNHVIVSLTSYGKRLGDVSLAVRSILRQSLKPDEVVLWIEEAADSSLVPADLKELESYGLDIRYGSKNLRGHKKYFWALREFSDSCVITIDDDVMYPSDTVESLMKAHERYPEAVVGRRVHRMTLIGDKLAPYVDWGFEWTESNAPRMDLMATGVGGILYPPHCFDAAAFDLDAIERTSLSNDDIWLKAQELMAGRGVAWAPCSIVHPYEIVPEQEDGLCDVNVGLGGNDKSISLVERELGISFADFIGQERG